MSSESPPEEKDEMQLGGCLGGGGGVLECLEENCMEHSNDFMLAVLLLQVVRSQNTT